MSRPFTHAHKIMDVVLWLKDRREALRDTEDIGIGTKNNIVENSITNNNFVEKNK